MLGEQACFNRENQGCKNPFLTDKTPSRAARSETEEGDHFTQIGIFDLNGEFYTDPPYIDVGARKFEGLAFPMV